MTYPDGSELLVGDALSFENGRTSGEIVAVIADDLADYSVKEPGILVKAAPFGLVFIPASRFAEERLALGQRGKAGFRWSGPTSQSNA